VEEQFLGRKRLGQDVRRIRTWIPQLITQLQDSTLPFTSTSWDGDAKGAGDSGTLDLSADFGAPANVRAVLVRAAVVDSATGETVRIGPDNVDYNALVCRPAVANIYAENSGLVPCDANGDIHVEISGDVDGVVISIWGYFL